MTGQELAASYLEAMKEIETLRESVRQIQKKAEALIDRRDEYQKLLNSMVRPKDYRTYVVGATALKITWSVNGGYIDIFDVEPACE